MRRSSTTSKNGDNGNGESLDERGAPTPSFGVVSYNVQVKAVLDLARRHGDPEPEIVTEWGVSGAAAGGTLGGTGRGGRRPQFAQLRERIAAGEVSSVYAYSLSRLARSTRELLDFAELCDGMGVPIRLAKEGETDVTSSSGRLYLTILAAVAAFEADVAAERARDRNAWARDNGRYIGKPPFGYTIDGQSGRLVENPVEMRTLKLAREAIAATTSYREAARYLNDRGIASPTGTRWRDGTIRRIVLRDQGRPEARNRTVRGSARVPSARFSRLLRCAHCKGRLTPRGKTYTLANGERASWMGYECQGSRLASDHPFPKSIAETAVLAWAKDELSDLPGLEERAASVAAAQAERAELDARRARLVEAVDRGTFTLAEVDERLAVIVDEVKALDARTVVEDVPDEVDWDAPVREVQAEVAAILGEITVDMTGPTFEAEWPDKTLRPRRRKRSRRPRKEG